MKKLFGLLISFLVCSTAIAAPLTQNYVIKAGVSPKTADSVIYDDGVNIGIGSTSPRGKLDVDGEIYLSGQIRIDGGIYGTSDFALDIGGANIHFIGVGDSIQTAINSSSSGDTIVLGPGTYSISPITISKSISIVGQGPETTKIIIASTASSGIYIDASNVNISGIGLTYTGTGNLKAAIEFNGTAGSVLSGGRLEDVKITMTAAGTSFGVNAVSAIDYSINAKDLNITINQTTSYTNGFLCRGASTADSDVTCNLYNSYINVSQSGTTAGTFGAYCQSTLSPSNVNLNIYFSHIKALRTGTSTTYGVTSDTSNSFVKIYNSYVFGSTYDLSQLLSASLIVYSTTLGNNLRNGTTTAEGTIFTDNLLLDGAIYP